MAYDEAGAAWSLSSTHGCVHLEGYKRCQPDGLAPGLFRAVKAVRFLFSPRKTALSCSTCPPHFGWRSRLHMCLHCVYLGCHDGEGHIHEHAKATNHYFSLDTLYFQVYCSQCQDYVYDADLERIVEHERSLALEAHLPPDGRRVPYKPWRPKSAKEYVTLCEHGRSGLVVSSRNFRALGLRGLSNLGNTCFANCIIQALAHNPLLRNFYLSGLHRRTPECSRRNETPPVLKQGDKVKARFRGGTKYYRGTVASITRDDMLGETCEVHYDDGDVEHGIPIDHVKLQQEKASAESGAKGSVADNSCLGCAMNTVFNELYSGVEAQYTPHKLLHAVWQSSKHLAGYSQQDAHEFFIALLDGMHSHCGGVSGPGCECIIHRIFTGNLQSDVVCSVCCSVSTTVDPFWDISLDIKRDPGTAAVGPTLTLADCLQNFTGTEVLGVDQKIHCVACAAKREGTKRLSMNRLPLVICFHLKRFEHSDRAKKINTYVSFPEMLDMQPYLSQSLAPQSGAASQAAGNGTKDDDVMIIDDPDLPAAACGASPDSLSDFGYELFAVINHWGTLQQGHYTCFVKLPQHGGQWFRCDDETVTLATLRDVLSSEAYMLFYSKSRLEYTK